MYIIYIDKSRYEVQEQKEVSVWYTGIYLHISSTGLDARELFEIQVFVNLLFVYNKNTVSEIN
jgi:hypothetical protein